jgi:D-aspartate ligase
MKKRDRTDEEDKPVAVVIGLDCITGLQSARILAARDVPVIGIASDLNHFACRTNSCGHIYYADTAGAGLIHLLQQLGPTFKEKAVLFPCTDGAVLTLSRHRYDLQAWYRMSLAEPEVVEMLMDKTRFTRFAQEAGLPVPAVCLLHNRDEAEAAAAQLTFPCILKPALKSATWEQHSAAKVYQVKTPDELLALYDRCRDWAEELLVQEWIEGSDANLYSCNCYFNEQSEPLVTFVARKLRQWPPEAGTSCLGEEVRDDMVLDETLRLFRTVDYRGLGYLEMKRDERSGRYYIIEPNIGRPTGRSAIAEAGGVELLYTMYCDLVGWPLPANRQQQYRGVKWIYWRRDLQSAFYYWRRGRLSLAGWWRSWQGLGHDAVWSRHDQGPFWADLWRSAGLLLAVASGEGAPSAGRRRKRARQSEVV